MPIYECDICGATVDHQQIKKIENQDVCHKCISEQNKLREDLTDKNHKEILATKSYENVIVTTTNNIDGYFISKYIGIESVEIVIGTGVFSEFETSISDFFGARSTNFEVKLNSAKHAAMSRIKYLAACQGGNAIVGVDIDYTEFSNNRIGVILNGTVVKIEVPQ